ncbi:recombinase family protein [Kitasatospora atroaurantiaca]|uniref:Recombinase n=1 Tax=Kitasatospora atroaurantiaca TaxID=285545 RepID=A0A561ERZ2_9ACTN|nr:recombinase family protein [Kitasatospora atroaurantiaca]TWE18376.1 recombinase [Kitasatospora atroaurantiaca]
MATATLTREAGKSLRSGSGMSENLTPAEAVETLRGLSSIRLSVKTDETTSPERQEEANDRVAALLNIDFGTGDARRSAVDLDVSASKVSPFDRPQLGKWLARPEEYDVIVWWRFDRAIRSMSDMNELAKWARKHRKMLVFAEGIGGGHQVFDFRNPMDPMAEFMLMLLAFAAQVESQSIKDRVTGAKAAMRKMEYRWAGGRIPYGYQPEQVEEGDWKGWTLVQDPKAVAVYLFMIGEILKGRAVNAIAQELTTQRIPCPGDHQRLKKVKAGSAEEAKILANLSPWRPGTIRELLASENMIGWKMHQKKPVRKDDGSPVLMTAEPILTREEFDHINGILDSRAKNPVQRKDTHAMLMRVALCSGCGSRMYLGEIDPETGDGRYRCGANTRGMKCTAQGLVKSLWLETYVTELFLSMAGHVEFTETRTTPGYDPEPELRATLAEFEEHQEQKGRQKSKAALAAWQKRADALDNRLAELETAEKVEARTERIGTGRTIAHAWREGDSETRRTILLEAGCTVLVGKGGRGKLSPSNEDRTMMLVQGDFDPSLEAVGDPAEDSGERPAPKAGSKLRIVAPGGVYELPARQDLAQAA